MLAGTGARLDLLERPAPAAPGVRRRGEAGGGEQVGAVEEQARVDVPGDAPERAGDDVGVPDAGEVIGRREGARAAERTCDKCAGFIVLRNLRRP